MKLKTLQTYQSVKFLSKQETYFQARLGMDDLEMTLNPQGWVEVSAKGQTILIFFTNIAFAIAADVQSLKLVKKA